MKFFFPDSFDLVDPSFDFELETRSPYRVRHQDDAYPHEVLDRPPYDGILVSKSIVDGAAGSTSKYSMAQRYRLLREGVRRFFRLDAVGSGKRLETIGDCGAFSYVLEKIPPVSVEEVLEFYGQCDFDYGVSVDHVILDYKPVLDDGLPGIETVPDEYRERQAITLALAEEFLRSHGQEGHRFTPIGVAQGWSPASYADSCDALQRMGYRVIGLGGIVPLKTEEILASLHAVGEVRRPETQLHLFGINRCDQIEQFAKYGVVSFDSTSPLRQAFKDDRDNYHTPTRAYTAIRVPQVASNPRLKRRIRMGEVDQALARRYERQCLGGLIAFDRQEATLEDVLPRLLEYDQLFDGRSDKTEVYREVLEDQPWKRCPCAVCRTIGVHVVIFRGAERNRRRGFHNLYVLHQKVEGILETISESASI